MSNILFDLSGKIDQQPVAVLSIVKKVADSLTIPFFVVGAWARDIILNHSYGMRTRRMRISWPPQTEISMSLVGCKEAYEYSVTVRLSSDPDLDIKLPPLPGLAIMKLISWKDGYPGRQRDAEDLLLIMQKCEEAGNSDRLYEKEQILLEEEGFDTRYAGISLPGRDMALMADPSTQSAINSILEAETGQESQYKLAIDMIKGSSNMGGEFDEILSLFEKLRQGFIEV